MRMAVSMLSVVPRAPIVTQPPRVAQPRPFWHEPDVLPAPGETTLQALIVYATENAYLRLRLADRELLDRTWHTHEGPWIPRDPLATIRGPVIPLDLLSVSDAARSVGRAREQLYEWIRAGLLPRYRRPHTVVPCVSLAEVQAVSDRRQRMGARVC